MIEAKDKYGDILFSEQKGARVSVNLSHPLNSFTVNPESKGWYSASLLESDETTAIDINELTQNLKLLDKLPDVKDQLKQAV